LSDPTEAVSEQASLKESGGLSDLTVRVTVSAEEEEEADPDPGTALDDDDDDDGSGGWTTGTWSEQIMITTSTP